jgi:hypothetical protein
LENWLRVSLNDQVAVHVAMRRQGDPGNVAQYVVFCDVRGVAEAYTGP